MEWFKKNLNTIHLGAYSVVILMWGMIELTTGFDLGFLILEIVALVVQIVTIVTFVFIIIENR